MSAASHPPSSVLLVQLTDSHLFAEPEGSLMGMRTRDGLEAVIARVREEQADFDGLLVTGDLSQDGSVASYRAFRDLTEGFAVPTRWLPGNHDERPPMEEAARGSSLLDPLLDVGNWRITLLDSSIAGCTAGQLADDQLQLLTRSLESAPDRHHLVCLHHHPVDVGCEWMQTIGLRNADVLLATLDAYAPVKALLWGHVHQAFDHSHHGVRLLASPSTCIQFAPGSADFRLDEQRGPGYRWLRLHDDGRLDTGVSRIDDVDFGIDFSGGGY